MIGSEDAIDVLGQEMIFEIENRFRSFLPIPSRNPYVLSSFLAKHDTWYGYR